MPPLSAHAENPLPPGLVIAALKSGSGKTTVMLGLIAALVRQGVKVQPFKCGPDYIDPAFHSAAAGRASANLDSWALSKAGFAANLSMASGADLVLAEGSMGLFDGAPSMGAWGDGSNADVAAATGWPVILVIDASGAAQSVGALALGAAKLRPDVTVAGVILNRLASPRHEALARLGVERAGLPVLGAIMRDDALVLPERHLGLVQAEEDATLSVRLERLADMAARALDIPAIQALAGQTGRFEALTRIEPPGQRIALARDVAFSFVYPHLLQGWRAAGAEILPFSPLRDESPDPSCDVCWLPGGYPELHAGTIASAHRFRSDLKHFASTRRVHGECGGYMALGQGLVDAAGQRFEMLGLLGLETSFAKRRLHLGYRRARLLAPIPGASPGDSLTGHEFHYASVLDQPDQPLAQVTSADGAPVAETGARRGTVTGTFFHMVDRIAA